ncbi:formate dehydrogenase, alpha subunit [Heliomicrobium modesticaldum Ice1]|uniref:Formate dehydrogenase, alpha subunit n=1 Tax=Heliobacterium modesticaldum (strain ATCC 51547 / Ice1) TaxID=498761 RepID=B0TCC6_HELMI|nr:formate dehydrogenase subunit alpha [Heliomicrobium modesticaldum]ABZ85314.1 formate dehydrogenase, alpha subunit [Heliomicrobium modesticaldum Ice1]
MLKADSLLRVVIDGQPLQGRQGMTLFELAQEVGIPIPHLCHEDSLHREGGCGLCVVEEEQTGRLVKACALPLQDGLAVRVESPAARDKRRANLLRILQDHRIECAECAKEDICALRRYAQDYHVEFAGELALLPEHPSLPLYPAVDVPLLPLKGGNPFIQRDEQKCTGCGSCERLCPSTALTSLQARGSVFGETAETASENAACDHCGICLNVCPTAALLETSPSASLKKRPVVPRKGPVAFKIAKPKIPADAQGVRTTCPYCGVGCQLQLKVHQGKVVGVGRDKSGSNGGQLCVKGQFGWEFIHHPDRLTEPLIRRGDRLEPATWEEALDLVSRQFQSLLSQYGGHALAGFSSAKCTNEENYLFQKFMRVALRSNHVDHCARLCHASTVAGLATAFGSGAMTNSLNELPLADVILIIGANVTETQPVTGYRLREAAKKGAKLIVIDPRRIDLVKEAHLWLRLRPGTNTALLNGMAHVILREGWWNRDFVAARTEGFDEWREGLRDYTPARVERLTGVPAEDLTEAARLYAQAERGSIVYAMGITQHTSGTNNVFAVANLSVLCGHLGREGTGVNPLRGQNNVQGACDMAALPNYYPGYRHILEAEERRFFASFWGVASLPDWVGKTVPEVLHGIHDGDIRGLFIMGENPILADPDSRNVEAALRRLDFLVVQDIFLTETARLAHVVLPAACFAEKDGTFTNTERRVQLIRKAVEPPGKARSDWEIVTALANRMGLPWRYDHPKEIMEEIAGCTPLYGGIRHERLEKAGLQWPCPHREHPGTPFLHEGRFTRGKGRFHRVEHLEADELPDRDYPLLLTTGRILYQYHTGSMSRRSSKLSAMAPEEKAMVHPDDASRFGLSDGDRAFVESRRGRLVTSIRLTEGVPPGVVFMTFHYAETPTNRLTNDATDPICRIPELKGCAIRLAPAGEQGIDLSFH